MFDDFDVFEREVGLPVFPRIGGWKFRNLTVDGDRSTTKINDRDISMTPYQQWMLERLLAEGDKLVSNADFTTGGDRCLKTNKWLLLQKLSAVDGPPIIRTELKHGFGLRMGSNEKVIRFLPPLERPSRLDGNTYQLGDWRFRPRYGRVWLRNDELRIPDYSLLALMLLAVNQGRAITYPSMNTVLGFENYVPRYVHVRVANLKQFIGGDFGKYIISKKRRGVIFNPRPQSERL